MPLVSLVLVFALMLVSSISLSSENSVSKSDPFECGMEVLEINRIPFHVHFYMVGVLFLIFDIEVVSSLPLIYLYPSTVYWEIWILYFFVMFVGLWFEIFLGTVDWKIH
uniref:NADH-ubiquinone oxidoreductase chain 3 n=1 Tax=Geomydoecus aurei TaxID=161607 RepID=A0A8F4RHH4_9NEOP|nr:NADH dehydrogenase subunit 3 [Geomydoecus aurei]